MEQKKGRVVALLLLIPLLCSGLRSILLGQWPVPPPEGFSSLGQRTESFLQTGLPFARTLKGAGIMVRYVAGQREQEGIFVLPNKLMKKVVVPDTTQAEKNTTALKDLLTEQVTNEQLVYFMLLPTAAAVFKEELPQDAPLFNQRSFIETINSQLAEHTTLLLAYNSLLENSNEYIYYRTEDNLTPRGGYRVFETMAPKLLGGTALAENRYEVFYRDHNYYGALYQTLPMPGILPDVKMEYYYREEPVEYKVTTWTQGIETELVGLFTENLEVQTQEGLGEQTKIESTNSDEPRLLLLGDHTVNAYLPFLAPYYSEVHIININEKQTQLHGNPEDYQQILIACSAATYANSTELPEIFEALQAKDQTG